MYLYSVLGFVVAALLYPAIRKQAPFECLVLAWVSIFDAVINAGYTAAFGFSWFLVVSQHHLASPNATRGTGSNMVDSTAGFTSPAQNVSKVIVTTDGATEQVVPGDAPAGTDTRASGVASSMNGIYQPEGFYSLLLVVVLWAIRIYFCLVMLAYARKCIKQYNMFANGVMPRPQTHSRTPSAASMFQSHDHELTESDPLNSDPNPFNNQGSPLSAGWRGVLGRLVFRLTRSYFLADDDNDSYKQSKWMRSYSRRFRRSPSGYTSPSSNSAFGFSYPATRSRRSSPAPFQGGGPSERERRRRSGTGPPLPNQMMLSRMMCQDKRSSVAEHSSMEDELSR